MNHNCTKLDEIKDIEIYMLPNNKWILAVQFNECKEWKHAHYSTIKCCPFCGSNFKSPYGEWLEVSDDLD